MTENLKLISDIYTLMSEKRILMSYMGDITPDITNAILKSIKSDSNQFNDEVVLQKKVYKIIVECLENIYRHSHLLEKNMRPSLFLLCKESEYYYIVTGNYINNIQVEAITNIANEINQLSLEDVKKKYREIISVGGISDSGGAGLGMIDIVIKSNNKLEYEFKPVSDGVSFYILKVKVSLI